MMAITVPSSVSVLLLETTLLQYLVVAILEGKFCCNSRTCTVMYVSEVSHKSCVRNCKIFEVVYC